MTVWRPIRGWRRWSSSAIFEEAFTNRIPITVSLIVFLAFSALPIHGEELSLERLRRLVVKSDGKGR